MCARAERKTDINADRDIDRKTGTDRKTDRQTETDLSSAAG